VLRIYKMRVGVQPDDVHVSLAMLVRRRTRSIGCFVNDASLERMIYGLFRFPNERRASKVCKEFRAASVAA
jgi:transposase-like protein